jgi:hypothetical protein
MNNSLIRKILTISVFIVLGFTLWYFRSWNTGIGDGEFCCKQVVGENPFAITVSRSLFSYLLYRNLFSFFHHYFNWWVEDAISLSSCMAGLLFFYSLYRLAKSSAKSIAEFWIVILFVSSTLLLQLFCGHIEFYSWTCAIMMLSLWWSWDAIEGKRSILWASSSLMIAAAFHSSGVFYFPALLLIPLLVKYRSLEFKKITAIDLWMPVVVFCLFFVTALLHRIPWIKLIVDGTTYLNKLIQGGSTGNDLLFMFVHLVVIAILATLIYCYLAFSSKEIKTILWPWWQVYLPWLIFFSLRTYFQLRTEPLLEHIPPFGEPYDHGAFHFEFFTWKHLFVKSTIHLFLMPFGLAWLVVFLSTKWSVIKNHCWLIFLLHYSLWALLWSSIFYPQLYLPSWDLFGSLFIPPRDFDLFATVSIPLNLFVIYSAKEILSKRFFITIACVAIAFQLILTAPIIVKNSGLLSDRGYVTLVYDPKPVSVRSFLRGLEIDRSPLTQRNVRAGRAEIRMIPTTRGYESWSKELYLYPDNRYTLDFDLPETQ